MIKTKACFLCTLRFVWRSYGIVSVGQLEIVSPTSSLSSCLPHPYCLPHPLGTSLVSFSKCPLSLSPSNDGIIQHFPASPERCTSGLCYLRITHVLCHMCCMSSIDYIIDFYFLLLSEPQRQRPPHMVSSLHPNLPRQRLTRYLFKVKLKSVAFYWRRCNFDDEICSYFALSISSRTQSPLCLFYVFYRCLFRQMGS